MVRHVVGHVSVLGGILELPKLSVRRLIYGGQRWTAAYGRLSPL